MRQAMTWLVQDVDSGIQELLPEERKHQHWQHLRSTNTNEFESRRWNTHIYKERETTQRGRGNNTKTAINPPRLLENNEQANDISKWPIFEERTNKNKNDANSFCGCFHGLGHRIRVRLYRKWMFFLHNSASALCSIEHKRIYLIESKASDALYPAEKEFMKLGKSHGCLPS